MRPLLVMFVALTASTSFAADLAIDGKWMITTIENPKDKDQGKMKLEPGAMTIEIHGTKLTTTDPFEPTADPKPSTLKVQEATAAKVVVLLTEGNDPPQKAVFTPEGKGLIMTTDDSVVHLVPYDADAVAKAKAHQKDEEAPAAPIGDHPITGRFGDAAWTATVCQRAQFQFPDDDGIRCELLAAKPPEHGPSPQSVMIVLPKKVGTYPLSSTRTVTFFTPPSHNLVASRGQIVVEKVDSDTITFGLSVRMDAEHDLNGKMTADLSESQKP